MLLKLFPIINQFNLNHSIHRPEETSKTQPKKKPQSKKQQLQDEKVHNVILSGNTIVDACKNFLHPISYNNQNI